MNETRPLLWSVRRELWENRSIYVVPIIVGAVQFVGFIISTIGMPHRRRALMLLSVAQQRSAIMQPYDFAAGSLMLTAFLVGFFYCLDALYGERRDRSILFWKSLPVSDWSTVLSKAAIPFVLLPIVTFVMIELTQLLMLFWTSLILAPSGLAGTTLRYFNAIEQTVVLVYSLIVIALWHAPLYAWSLLISAWAKRATFVWAVAPPLVIALLEHVAFNAHDFSLLLKSRFIGFAATAFTKPGRIDSISQLSPGSFILTPGLWGGLIFAALTITAAVRMRRYRAPI